jgi:hypothetical protein
VNYNKLLNLYGLSPDNFSYQRSAETFTVESQKTNCEEHSKGNIEFNPDMLDTILQDDRDSFSNLDGWTEEDDFEY